MFGAGVRGSIFERAALSILLIVPPLQLAAMGAAEYRGEGTLAARFGFSQTLWYAPGIVRARAPRASFTRGGVRRSVWWGKGVSVGVELGGRGIMKKKRHK